MVWEDREVFMVVIVIVVGKGVLVIDNGYVFIINCNLLIEVILKNIFRYVIKVCFCYYFYLYLGIIFYFIFNNSYFNLKEKYFNI